MLNIKSSFNFFYSNFWAVFEEIMTVFFHFLSIKMNDYYKLNNMRQINYKQKQYQPTIISISLIFVVIIGISRTMQAQVTIGLGEEPIAGSALQLKEITGVTDDSHNAYRGLALPRVNLSDKSQLYPMFLLNPEDPNSGPNTNYTANKNSLDISHTGLIVYNLVEDKVKDLCKGLNQWDGTQWMCFQNKVDSATFSTVTSSDVGVSGSYTQGTPLTSDNNMKIHLNVTKTGHYNLKITTDNGYSFHQVGVASDLGDLIVNLPGQGTPVNAKNDHLVFNGVVKDPSFDPIITVVSPISNYSINCSSITVNGSYMKGTALTSSNTITLNVTVSTTGSYTISTPLTNGISFTGSGSFSTTGTQTVTLTGSGTPTVNTDFPITINANTLQGNNTCSATIYMTLPAMTYAIIGSTSEWSWGATARRNAMNTGSGFGASFGTNGVVKIASLTQAWQTADIATATNHLNNDAVKPDVVLYFSFGASTSDVPTANNIATALATYINKGGCVIFAPDGTTTPTNQMLNAIFGTGSGTAQLQVPGSGTTADNDYPIANLPNDPIINGPFGNLSANKYWGEDNDSNGSIVLPSLPSGSVQICSAYNPFGKTSVNPAYSIVWYSDRKNFVYFGDSTGSAINNNVQDADPSNFGSTGLPLSKFYGNYPYVSAPSQYVYNSALELNALAWALKKAAVSGINPH